MANADWGHAPGYPAQAGHGNYQGNQYGQYGTQQGYSQQGAPAQHPAGGHYAQAPQAPQPHPQQGHRAEPPMRAQPQHQPQHQPQSYQQPQGYQQPQAGYGYAPQPQHAAPHPHGYEPNGYYAQAAAPIPVEVEAEAGRFSRAMNIFGAVVSISLIGGLAVWGYKLAMRDVTEIPVVAALEGPMRVQPDNPGGVAADHQGLAVNNVAAEGVAAGPAPQVTLAPAAEELGETDMPVVAQAEINAVSGAEAEDAPGSDAPAEAEITPAAASAADTRAATQALIDQITADVAPLSEDESDLAMTDEAVDAMTAGADQVVRISADVPGVARSIVPRARPSGLVTRAAASPSSDPLIAATPSASQSDTREMAAADIPVGTRLVQLGAYDSEDVARSEWDALAGKFDEFMVGKTRVIEMAQSGGKTFYRLRAMGFDDLSDARRFCSALMAGQAACIPVVTR